MCFTAINDDSVGGDTNNDGSEILPAAQHWGGVVFSERSDDENSVIDYLDIRYTGNGGLGAVILENASPTLSNIIFEENYMNEVSTADE